MSYVHVSPPQEKCNDVLQTFINKVKVNNNIQMMGRMWRERNTSTLLVEM